MEERIDQIDTDLEEICVDKMHIFVKQFCTHVSNGSKDMIKIDMEQKLYGVLKKYV